MHVLVAGVGWLGRELALRLLREGHRVTGVRRRTEGQGALVEAGIRPVAADLSDPRSVQHLPWDVDAVVACQAAGSADLASYRTAYVDANRVLLDWSANNGVSSYVYTGSTGVFGQDDGTDVDEDTPVCATSESASVLVEAEEIVRGFTGPGGRIVRLSGLYGPGRYGLIERVRSGALGLGPGDYAWMNFCHLEDAASVVLAALFRGRPGAVYHGSDAEPARRRDVVTWVAERLGTPPRRTAGGPGRAPGGRRGANRRVLSGKSRSELEVDLRFPSFREGLAPAL